MLLVLADKPDARVVLRALEPYFEQAGREWPSHTSHDRPAAGAGHQLWLLRGWRGGWPRTPAVP
jgi:hypothetical protein